MIKIDAKDKKILYHLFQNSRQSFKVLGRKIGVSSDLISYRIKRLIKNRVITDFIVNLNIGKLGYTIVNEYYKFENITPKIKDEILNYLIKNNMTRYIGSIEGYYDLQVNYHVRDTLKFESFLDEFKMKYNRFLYNRYGIFVIRGEIHNFPFLLDSTINKGEPKFWGWGNREIVKIDDLDYKILKELSNDSRIPTKSIANNLNSTVTTINQRIKKLEETRVINNYTINIDWSKIGYRYFHIQITLNEYSKKNKIMKFLRSNPHIYMIFKAIGYNIDIHCTFCLKSVEHMRSIIEDVTSKYPDVIKNCDFFSTYRIHKNNLMIP
jgi:DNA-binding Lrp family transcriptional regulator